MLESKRIIIFMGKTICMGVMLLLLLPVFLVFAVPYSIIITMYDYYEKCLLDSAFWVGEFVMLILASITVPLAVKVFKIWFKITKSILTMKIEDSDSAENLGEDESASIDDFLIDITQMEGVSFKINELIQTVKNYDLKQQLEKIQEVLNRIINYLNDHPEKASIVHSHIDYYLEKTLLFTHLYIDLEKTMLDTPEVKKAKDEILEIFKGFEKAYEIEFSQIMSYSLLELNASLAVANDILNEQKN